MPVYRVYFSEKDSKELAVREPPREVSEEVDFSKVVVDKPWGFEYLVHKTPYAHTWGLHIKKDALTSMHSHPNKKTGLLVLEGSAAFSTLNTTIRLKRFDSVIIETGVFHSTRAVSEGGVRLLEIETPPRKFDLVRLKDDYGRAGTLYESKKFMRPISNGVVQLPDLEAPGYEERRYYENTVGIHRLRGGYGPQDERILAGSEVMVILEGQIHSRKGQLLHSVADIISRAEYLNNLNSHVVWDLTLLLVKSPS